MKRMLGAILLALSVTASAADQNFSMSEAIETFERITRPTESAAGLYALETPKQRQFSPDIPITVDAECLRFAIIAGGRDKPMCRRHADIDKLFIAKITKKNIFAKANPGDHEIVVFYKGIGKLAIFNLNAEEVDPFIDAVRVLSPSLKKIKDKR